MDASESLQDQGCLLEAYTYWGTSGSSLTISDLGFWLAQLLGFDILSTRILS